MFSKSKVPPFARNLHFPSLVGMRLFSLLWIVVYLHKHPVFLILVYIYIYFHIVLYLHELPVPPSVFNLSVTPFPMLCVISRHMFDPIPLEPEFFSI